MPRHFHFGHRLDIFKTTSQLFQPYQVQHLRKKEVCVWVLSHMMFNNADFNGPSGKIKVWVPPQILSEYAYRGMEKCKKNWRDPSVPWHLWSNQVIFSMIEHKCPGTGEVPGVYSNHFFIFAFLYMYILMFWKNLWWNSNFLVPIELMVFSTFESIVWLSRGWGVRGLLGNPWKKCHHLQQYHYKM